MKFPDRHRTWAATLVFLLIGGIGTAVAGTAQVTSEEMPASFQVTAPLDGDYGAYNFTSYDRVDGAWIAADDSVQAFRFLHRFRPWSLDGEPVLLEEVGEFHDWGCNVNGQRVVGYESDLHLPEGPIVGHGKGCTTFGTSEVRADSNYGKRLFSWGEESFWMEDEPHPSARFCGHINAFQRGPVKVDDLPEIFPRCRINWYDGQGPAYKAIGTAPYHDEAALVVEAVLKTESGETRSHWWFVESVPYPVRLDQETDGRLRVWDLAALHRGTEPPALPVALPSPFVTPWGFQGPLEDIVHPFPLSAAVDAARSDPNGGLSAFLADHPDAVVQEAKYRDLDDNTSHSEWWRFVLSDDTAARQFSVSKDTDSAGGEFLAHIIGQAGPQTVPTYQVQYQDVNRSLRYLDPASMPAVPAVSSLWGLYHALSGRQANAWGIDTCAAYCFDEAPFIAVGESHENATAEWKDGDFAAPSHHGRDDERLTLYATADGAPFAWVETRSQDEYGPDVKAHDAAMEPMDYAIGPTKKGSLWAWHFGPAAVAGGLIGLVSALTYWLWPALKSGAVGLFTRIKEDGLLDHPSRRRIMEIVAADPGIHLRRLTQETGLGSGNLRYHLGRLVEAGKLRVVRQGGFACHYLVGQASGDVPESIRSKGYQKVAECLCQEPDASTARLARLTGLAESTVRYHLRSLRP